MNWWKACTSIVLDRDGMAYSASDNYRCLGHISGPMPDNLARLQVWQWEWLARKWAEQGPP